MKIPALITIADAAKLAGCTPRTMRRWLEKKNGDGKLLERRSNARRGKLWVKVKELKRIGCDWLSSVDSDLDEARVRDIVVEEVRHRTQRFFLELRSVDQRLNIIEEMVNARLPKDGQKGTK